ncbi:MAG: enoyl-CoA hydratase/isomerase family protein [Deltaproteobacteria bacterium]|nr:enoyl-CoA hydratase/isomerase family protein [Deltaproteobacteria bacterium]MBW1897352.1 enoyl-CoA hydratase/isomerase family protein [Deltaproteobacteria bacterium]
MKSKVHTIKEDGVALVTLNRPKVYNAVDEEMLKLLAGQLSDLSFDKGVSAVVITGEGKVFCSGGDLRSIHDFPKGAAQGVYELATLFHQVVEEIRRMKKPVIAAINGVAAGGGLSLALACDFRVMGHSATLIQAYTSHGLSIDGGASFILPRLVGLARAMEIVAFDKPIPAEQALALGLVTEVAEDGQVLEVAKGMASRFGESSLLAFGVCKRLMLDSFHTSLEAQLENERVGISRCVAHGDGEEGIRAFLEKRKPVFKDK